MEITKTNIQPFDNQYYFRCSKCGRFSLIEDYEEFYRDSLHKKYKCPKCENSFVLNEDSINIRGNTTQQSIRLDSMEDNSMYAYGRISWMFDKDTGRRFDFQDDAIEQAQREMVAEIEGATRNIQSRKNRTDNYTTDQDDAYKDGLDSQSEDPIKKAQLEMIAEIEQASRQPRRR